MPQLGEIKNCQEIGYKGRSLKYIWSACVDCGKERWVLFRIHKGEPVSKRCSPCAAKLQPHPLGAKSHKWKGGRYKNAQGYVEVWIDANDFFFPMVKSNGYVLEHRLVMARHLGRCLQPWELVHHKGIRYVGVENRSDNLIDNLGLTTNGSHSREHNKGYRDGYEKGFLDGGSAKIKQLEARIKELERLVV